MEYIGTLEGVLGRAAGALVGSAVGDALGAPHEFQPPLPAHTPIDMTGGGAFGWGRGEWTDDTQMAICIARAALAHPNSPITSTEVLDDIANQFITWMQTAKDVGSQTSMVLSQARVNGGTAAAAREAAAGFAYRSPTHTGTGSLMRTAPVAVATAHLPAADIMAAARAVAELTHYSPDGVEAPMLWCVEIATAINDPEAPLGTGFNVALQDRSMFTADRAELWQQRIAAARSGMPWDFPDNGRIVHAFQAAVSAVSHDGTASFAAGARQAVRCGNDTDTVAAIAGALLGARWAIDSIPTEWVNVCHGWPDWTAADLAGAAVRLAAELSHRRD